MEIDGLNVEPLPDSGILVCKLVGTVRRTSVPHAEGAVKELIARGHRRLIIDLSEAERVSSTGLGLMLYYERELRDNGGCLVVVRPRGPVARALSVSNLDKVFRVYETQEEAVAAIKQDAAAGESA